MGVNSFILPFLSIKRNVSNPQPVNGFAKPFLNESFQSIVRSRKELEGFLFNPKSRLELIKPIRRIVEDVIKVAAIIAFFAGATFQKNKRKTIAVIKRDIIDPIPKVKKRMIARNIEYRIASLDFPQRNIDRGIAKISSADKWLWP